jgi:hypothetical protein
MKSLFSRSLPPSTSPQEDGVNNITAVHASVIAARDDDRVATFPLTKLPTDIFYTIHSFLPAKDFIVVLNSNNKEYGQIKMKTMIYRLTQYFSWKFYYNEEDFRTNLLSRIKFPERQLSLNLSTNVIYTNPKTISSRSPMFSEGRCCESIEGISSLSTNHLEYVVSFASLKNLTSVSLEWNNFRESDEFPYLFGNIQYLKLRNHSSLHSVATLSHIPHVALIGCSNLRDITPLKKCLSLHFEDCFELRDIFCLSGFYQKKLTFINCRSISSVNHLCDVRELRFINCYSVSNVSLLGNVYSLTIKDCSVDDISNLTANRYLSIDHCNSISNFSSLKCHDIPQLLSLKNMRLRGLSSISSTCYSLILENCQLFCSLNFHELTQLYRLELNVCPTLTTTKHLGKVPYLTLSDCQTLTSLEGLGHGNRHVVIAGCQSISDFFALQSIYYLEIISCKLFSSLQCLKNCIAIKLRLCVNLQLQHDDFSCLEKVRSLSLSFCTSIKSLKGLSTTKVEIIDITDCRLLSDIDDLGKISNQMISLSGCPAITRVSHLREVSRVKIYYCNNIKDLSLLNKGNLIFIPVN